MIDIKMFFCELFYFFFYTCQVCFIHFEGIYSCMQAKILCLPGGLDFFYFETESCDVAQASLELVIFLPQVLGLETDTTMPSRILYLHKGYIL
jgi:hypothetical protein